jgi:hypothetical protein
MGLLEKPPVARPLKNFPTFYGFRRFNIVFTGAFQYPSESTKVPASIRSAISALWDHKLGTTAEKNPAEDHASSD